MIIKTSIESINAIKQKISSGEKTFFVRFGDNDVWQMSGMREFHIPINKPLGGNRTIHSHALKKSIKKSFLINHKNYLKALTYKWPMEPGMINTQFDPRLKSIPAKFINEYVRKLTIQKEFYNPVCFHYLACFMPELFSKFSEGYIKPFKKLYIGYIDPEKLYMFGKFDYWIKTDQFNSFDGFKDHVELIKKSEKVDMIISASGQLSRVLASYLWKRTKAHYIDIGSVVNGMAGSPNRGYLMKFGKKIKKLNDSFNVGAAVKSKIH